MHELALKNWIPYKLENKAAQLQCYWLNTFAEPFTEPFFDDTIIKCRRLSDGHPLFESVSDLAMLKEWATGLDSLEPAAFIFHISRCGSTLVSQLLATSNEHIVLSEVPFFDDLLRLPHQGSNFNQDTVSDLLVAAIKFYAQKRTGQEKRLFIKTDSWHIFFYKQLRIIFPEVPFILIYRSPDQVLASHMKMPGMQAVPGLIEPAIFGFKPEEIMYNRPDIYLSNVLEKYLDQYHEIIATDRKCLLLNYNDGPVALIKKIAAFTNTPLSKEALLSMDERSRYHSKRPNEPFSEISPLQKPPFLHKAMELYQALNSNL
jgi:hypothetical protein